PVRSIVGPATCRPDNLCDMRSVGLYRRYAEADVGEHDRVSVVGPLWRVRPAVVDDRVRAADDVGYSQRGRVVIGDLGSCRIPAVAPDIGPQGAIQSERNRCRTRLRSEPGDVTVGAKLEGRRVDSALGDDAARPAPRLDRDLLAPGNPLQREGW